MRAGLVADDLPVPGQQLVHSGVRKRRDAPEDVGEPPVRVDVVELAGGDEDIHRHGALAAAVGAGEQPRASAQGNTTQAAFRGILCISVTTCSYRWVYATVPPTARFGRSLERTLHRSP